MGQATELVSPALRRYKPFANSYYANACLLFQDVPESDAITVVTLWYNVV
jgi:hypothetical protein